MLEDLPVEIVHHITQKLNQNEIVSLARTSSFFAKLLIPRLYSVITIESSPKVFGSSRIYENHEKFQVENNLLSSIKISSYYALRLFFKCLIRHPEYCSFVKVLVFKNSIPDIEDSKLFGYLKQTICHMNNLKIFRLDRKSINVPLEWFHREISEIQGKIVGNTKRELNLNVLGLINSIDLTSSNNIHLSNLQELSILKSNDLHIFENLFKNNKNKISLKKLVIENSHLDYHRADLLDHHVQLSHLQSLSIPLSEGCQAIKYNSFLQRLVPNMTNLSELTFSTTDHRLLEPLKSLHLHKLKVLCHSNKFDLGLILASINRDTLIQLEIDSITDISEGKCPIASIGNIKLLQSFTKLKMLSLPVKDEVMLELTKHLPTTLEKVVMKCSSGEIVENSLVDYNYDHYWQSFQIIRENTQQALFISIVEKFCQKSTNLKWVGFEKGNKSYLYQINTGKVVKYDRVCMRDMRDMRDIEHTIMHNK